MVAVRLQEVAHFGLGEAEHLVEFRLQADVGADVEAAGHVVHGDRRDAGDEQPLQAAGAGTGLERGEEVAVEAAAVGERPVGVGAVLGQDGVGEVVVLVDHHVEGNAAITSVNEQLVQLAAGARRREDATPLRFGEQVRVALHRVLDVPVAILLEALLQGLQRLADGGEIEEQDDVAAAVGGGVAADVRAGEDPLEVLLLGAVVVALQQRQPAGLAEAAGADEEDVAFGLEPAQEARLVHVQATFEPDFLEVGPAVGDGGEARHGTYPARFRSNDPRPAGSRPNCFRSSARQTACRFNLRPALARTRSRGAREWRACPRARPRAVRERRRPRSSPPGRPPYIPIRPHP